MLLENLIALLPQGPGGPPATVLRPDTGLAMVATGDIGAAAARAIAEPDRFHEVELELAGDLLTMAGVARTLSELWGKPVVAPSMDPEQALAAGMPAWGAGHQLTNAFAQPARPEFARALGIPVTPFADWARVHLAI